MVPAGTTSVEGVPSTGVTVKGLPEQIVGVLAAITGFGLTVTVTLKVAVQIFVPVPEDAVTG